MKLSFSALLIAVLVCTITLVVPVAYATSGSPDISSVLSSLFTNTGSLLTFVIELALGLGLGYFAAKALKYIIALVAIFVVGVLLNVWQSPQITDSIRTILAANGISVSNLPSVFMTIIIALGLTTVLPITIGFIIGVVIAIAK